MSLATNGHSNGVYTDKHSGLNNYNNYSGSRGHAFANPIPLGIAAHTLGLLVYGSYLANWRIVNTPLQIAVIGLGIAGPGCFLAAILSFIVNDTFWNTFFIVLSGLWYALGISYLPLSGLATFYDTTAEGNSNFEEAIAIFLIWFGIFIFVHALVSSRRNFIYPAHFVLTALGLWIASASYMNHNISSSKLSKASGYILIVAGLLGVYYVVAALLASEHHKIKLPVFGNKHVGPQRLDSDIRGDGNLAHTERNDLHHNGTAHNNTLGHNSNTVGHNSNTVGHNAPLTGTTATPAPAIRA